MRTVRALSSPGPRNPIWARFPARTLVLTLTFVTAAVAVFAIVDRVAPAPAPAKPAAVPAVAEGGRKDLRQSEARPASIGPLVAIGGVLAGAVGLVVLLKRVLKGSRHLPESRRLLKVRDVLAMGPKRAIYLIGLEDRNLVVGLSGDQMTLLSEYSEGTEPEEAVAPAPAPARDGRTGELAIVRSAAPLQAPAIAAVLDAVAGDEVTVPPADPDPTETPARPRAFSFASVNQEAARTAKPRTDRVPHKFRQLLEQAARSDGAGG